MDGPAGGYVPTVRGGGTMRVRMTCLGRHWNARTYTYEATRGDHDGQPVEAVPEDWVALAARLAADAGFAMRADVCLINWYGADGRMGLHQDKDESPASIAAGVPVVSISLGDSARFLFGGTRRRDPGGDAVARVGRRVRVRRAGAPPLPRRDAHPAGLGAARARHRRTVQSNLPPVR